MPLSNEPVPRAPNRLLEDLPRAAYGRLLPGLVAVPLAIGDVVDRLGERSAYAYFPTTAVLSMISVMANGRTAETGMIGAEGAAALAVCLGVGVAPSHTICQIAGDAVRIRSGALKTEFDRGGALHDLLLRHVYALFGQLSQSIGCNTHHPIEARLCRWLLIVHDRVPADVLLLRHEFLSQMLGSRRSAVTIAAGSLRAAGLIAYARGKITVLDRSGLEGRACECYVAVSSMFERGHRQRPLTTLTVHSSVWLRSVSHIAYCHRCPAEGLITIKRLISIGPAITPDTRSALGRDPVADSADPLFFQPAIGAMVWCGFSGRGSAAGVTLVVSSSRKGLRDER